MLEPLQWFGCILKSPFCGHLGEGMNCLKAPSFRVQILIEFDVHSFVLASIADVVYDN